MSNKFERIASEVGKLTAEKNLAYGDSYSRACNVLQELYPNGVQPHQYRDMLATVRVIDKLFRLATRKDAFGESPWRDICGYSLLGIAADEVAATDKEPYDLIDPADEEINRRASRSEYPAPIEAESPYKENGRQKLLKELSVKQNTPINRPLCAPGVYEK